LVGAGLADVAGQNPIRFTSRRQIVSERLTADFERSIVIEQMPPALPARHRSGSRRHHRSPKSPPIILSSQGLDRAASASEEAFVFRGNGWEFECTQFEAVFISPRVHRLLEQDRTVNSLTVELKSEGVDEKQIFGYFEDLMKGGEIAPIGSDREGFLEATAFLGNAELARKIFDTVGPLDEANVCDRLQTKYDAVYRLMATLILQRHISTNLISSL
jgi:hypothetical protein